MAIVLKAHYGKRQALEEVQETLARAETDEAQANLGRLRESLKGLAESRGAPQAAVPL